MIVVDVNILSHYAIQGSRTEEAHRLWAQDAQWVIPSFWRIEFQSILWKCVRFQDMPRKEALAIMERALQLYSGNEQPISPGAALQEALASGISVYDAQYVALARQLDVPCVSLDKALHKACPDRVLLLDAYLADPSGDGLIRESRTDYRVKRRRKRSQPAWPA